MDCFLCLLLGGDVDSKDREVLSEVFVVPIVITGVAVDGSCAVGGDGPELADEWVLRRLEMVDGMIVAAGAIPVLAPAPEVPACHAEPEVSGQFAFATVR